MEQSKKRFFIIGLIVAGILIGAWIFISRMQSSPKENHEGHASVEQTQTPAETHVGHETSHGKASEAAAHPGAYQHWCKEYKEGEICSMLIFVKEGEAPKCPMTGETLSKEELIPVEQPEDIMGYTAVSLSQERQQMIGIRTAKITRQPAVKVVRTVGRIAYDAELYQAQEEYLQALGASEKAKTGDIPEITTQAVKLVQSTKTRLEILGLNQELIDDIQKAGIPDKSLLLAAPGGTVWMYAPVYEQDLAVIKLGQEVAVTAPKLIAGKKFTGIIRAVDPVLDPKTRSARIRAVLENPEGFLKPNVYVNAEIRIKLGAQLMIPESAVLDSGERQLAFVATGKGIFEPRLLQLGPMTKGQFVVISGVHEGEEVVDQAAFFVDSESKLEAAVGPAGGHAGHGA